MRKYLRVSEAAEQLKVSATTLRRYVSEGLIPCSYSPSNQRVFSQEDLDLFMGRQRSQSKVFYVRSSDGDKNKLDSQISVLKSAYGEPGIVIKDKASGLNDKRRGLFKIIKLAQEKAVTDIYVTSKDRLTRFGFNYLQELFNQNKVTIHVLSEAEEKTLQEELLQDFMSLIASFSGKFYRLRGYEQQKQLLEKAGKTLEEKTH